MAAVPNVKMTTACLAFLVAGGCAADVRPSPTGPGLSPSASSMSSAGPTATLSLSPAATSPAATRPGGPSPDPALLDGIEWTLAPDSDAFSSFDTISDAIAFGGGVIAVGADSDPLAGGGVIWVSADGTSWQRLTEVPATEGRGGEIASIANGPGGLIAGGYGLPLGRPAPAVWISSDGAQWELVDAPQLGAGEIVAVAGSPAGWVALGTDIQSSDANLAWTSIDGRDWSVPLPAEALGRQPSVSDVASVNGTFMAFGERDESAMLWTSPDGRAWEMVAGFPIAPGSVVNALAATPARLVAVGADYRRGAASAVVWTSTDGLAWQQLPQVAGMAGAEMLSVLAVGDGFIAAGSEGGGGPRGGRAAVWTSADGLDWQRLGDDPSFGLARMSLLVAAGPGLIALGERAVDQSGEILQPAVWSGTARATP